MAEEVRRAQGAVPLLPPRVRAGRCVVQRSHCRRGASRRDLATAVATAVAAASLAAAAGAPRVAAQAQAGGGGSSCWTEGFQFEDCCTPDYGPAGNEECWDEVYTYDTCCGGSGRDPAHAGCDAEYFQTFRRIVVEFYATELVRPKLVELYPRLIGNVAARIKLCAPAVLQAMLLELEERAAVESPSWASERLASYAIRLQGALERGWLSPGDVERWPLDRGAERVRTLLAAKARRSSSRRPPGVALVLSYCREDLTWLNSTLRRNELRDVELVVVRKCPGVNVRAAVPFRHAWRSVKVVDVEDLPFRADECSAYLGYLAHDYESLPESMVFVHADAPEHIGGLDRPNILDDTLRALITGLRVPFAHLGGNRVTMRWDTNTMPTLWKGLFRSSLAPGPMEVKTYCCSHFVVTRDRVQQRPRGFYHDALRFVTSRASYEYMPVPNAPIGRDVQGRLVCQNMMFVWHVIFGEALNLPHRMFDPSLPLFLKVRNLRTAYMSLDA